MDESEHPTPADRPGEPSGSEAPLDPAVDARVRALLAEAGQGAGGAPMPSVVSDRIAAALADEARLRVSRGPLAGTDGTEGTGGAVGAVVPLESRRRQRPWVAVAAVAAAAAVVAVGASALHVTKRPSPAAVVAGETPSITTTSATPAAVGNPHIQLSTTDYRSGTFGAQARDLLDHPATPLPDLAAESPSLGPIATPVGLASCLDAIGAGGGAVSLDLASFEGRPAAVIVVTRDGTSTAYAVERSCAPGNVTALAGATPVP
ncbi:hypothetical protein FHX52_3668 [Humibacillus xanthopallidus]|uniref:Uncharacterized protein n=1 Tax=Humibacillus xanthopallidus TaxID=412689 RepID=A0A543PK55_9MICO|nr:hypothetical protein [Humibacillus xanthopallidus]TQN44455.1 hypothetical protein FHX52_3668 [Humibacillus xanthopallidus]